MNSVAQTFEQALQHHRLGNLQQAELLYRQILQIDPCHANAHHHLGLIAQQLGKNDLAIASIQQALQLHPELPDAHYNLGIALQHQGRLEEALASYRQALRLRPDDVRAMMNQGNVLADQGKRDEAIASYRQALAIQPDNAEVYNNLGTVQSEQGDLAAAMWSYQQAVRLQPGYAQAHNNLANALKDLGRIEDAIAALLTAITLKPDDAVFHANLVYFLHYHPGRDADALYREARRWNRLHAEPFAKFQQPHANGADPERRLRIGYVSPDFCNHALAYVLLPLLSNHDRHQVEVYCYAEVSRPDGMTGRLRACADVWRGTVGLSDESMADLIRQDRIDILIDLALHTNKNRLLVFARKPAPVQITWLGYPGTTGLSAIDYRLTDPYFDSPGVGDACYSEQSIRLPDTFWCYDPDAEPPVNDLPACANGFVTFGCLNNFCKVNERLLVIWSKVLRALPNSRLLLVCPRGPVRDGVLETFQREGVAASQLQFVDRTTRGEYLQMYNRIDVSLDPWPCNGGVTSLDAFWMGVPVVTLVGETAVGRSGLSLLSNLGLPELAARTPEQYVAIAAGLAGDLPRLQMLRAGLRARLRASTLMDGPRFARNMEQAYRQMWWKWCAGAD
jgi:predicted O-linked N-acetylglucosamine transferase (SPINDLY family)